MRFVIVSSLDALARLAAAKYLARRWPSAEFIRWDITADGALMRKHHRNGNLRFLHASPLDVTEPGHADQGAAARHDLAHHVADQASATADDELIVLLLPMGFPSEDAVAALRAPERTSESPEIRIQSVLFAVDPETVEDTLWDVSPAVEFDSRPALPAVHETPKGEPRFMPEREYCRTSGEFLAAEVAHSSSLLAVNNLDSALAPHHPEQWDRGIELIGEIAPHLTIVDATATPRRSSSTHAGMFASFDEHAAKQRRRPGSIPEYDGAAASTVVLRTSQPVDPALFHRALGTMVAGACRVRGTVHFHTDPSRTVAIEGVGPHVWLEPKEQEPTTLDYIASVLNASTAAATLPDRARRHVSLLPDGLCGCTIAITGSFLDGGQLHELLHAATGAPVDEPPSTNPCQDTPPTQTKETP